MADQREADIFGALTEQFFNEKMADGNNQAKTAQNDAMSNALTAAREQELHGIAMLNEAEKLKGQTLKNQQAEQKLQLEMAKAQAEGLAVNIQDPQPAAITRQEAMAGTKVPSRGSQNPSQFLLNVLDEARKARKIQVGEAPREENAITKQEDFVVQQIMDQLTKIGSEKHLSRGPLGQAGSMLGGLLDIVSGPLDIGTEIFGGTLPVEARTELLTRALGYISPIARARATNMLGRDKYELDAERLLRKSGLGSASGLLKSNTDMEGADEIMSLGIDMRMDLQNGVPDSFSSEAVTGIGDAFNKFEQIYALIDSLKDASEEEAKLIEQKLVEADREMREPIQQFLASGGTPEKIKQDILAAKKLINEKHQTALTPIAGIPSDKYTIQLQAKRKVVAQDLTNKLTNFYSAVVGNLPMDKEVVEKAKLGEEKYAAKQKYEGQIKGKVDETDYESARKAGAAGATSFARSVREYDWKDTYNLIAAAKGLQSDTVKEKDFADRLNKLDISREEMQKLKMLILGELDGKDKDRYMKVRNFLVDYQNKRFK